MSAREPAFRDAVRDRYNQIETIWDDADAWHQIVRRQIADAVRRLNRQHPGPHELVVDVGSGGEEQPIPHRGYIQLDLASDRLKGMRMAACADAHALPLRDGSADCLVCVGSVANYCSLIELTQEFGRTCADGGLLLFHVELSNSLEYLFRPEFRAMAALATTHYQGRPEQTWVYSHRNVRQALGSAGFDVLDARYFHIASALAHRLGLAPGRAARLTKLDALLGRLPGIASVSDSAIFTCVRRAS